MQRADAPKFVFLRLMNVSLKKWISVGCLLLVAACGTPARKTNVLLQQIEQIATSKNAEIGVAIARDDGSDVVMYNGDKRFPMQSVFKFHIAAALLSEIDKGKFAVDQQIIIGPEDLTPDIWSPIREAYPTGVELTIADAIEYMVSQSDNVACDVLLRLIGGPEVVEDFFIERGITDISIKINEEIMQANWDLQFQNWTTPRAANEALALFYRNENGQLSKESHNFIWEVMEKTQTGPNRLKGHLPIGTVVAHKTGFSGTNEEGITAAVHDIGVIKLPQGGHFFISVLLTNSTENIETNERIIADIAKAAWDYFSNETE